MSKNKQTPVPSTMPNQLLSWSEKIADNHEWFKQNTQYLISKSRFVSPTSNTENRAATSTGQFKLSPNVLYDMYNSRFPANWFSTTVNPYNSNKEEFKRWPAKIRPVNILRTNIDFLCGEFAGRKLRFKVNNYDPGGYNSFLEEIQNKLSKNLMDHFTEIVRQQAIAQGLPLDKIPPQEDIELPWSVKEKFTDNYKDPLAIFGQKHINRMIAEYKLKRKFNKLFKDYMIVGNAFSYKGIEKGRMVYEDIFSNDISYEKSPQTDMVEDGSWVVARRWLTAAEVTDRFYGDLTEDQLKYVEFKNGVIGPTGFHLWLGGLVRSDYNNLIPVYHVQWKGRRKIKFTTSVSADGTLVEETHDEDYIVPEGVDVEETYVNEAYECWRIADHIFVNPRIIPNQRNVLNNQSICKLSYNGVSFSDRGSANISPMEIGLPYQMLFMITGFILEKTIAKSKGKIVIMDKNAIPRDSGWSDDKFFYYADALGYALVNRNQIGADKSMTAYQVMDLGLFEHIKELINLQQYFKSEWDELLGITRQRKGQMMASDDVGNSQASITQSSIITDTLFINFEDFIEAELQGIFDLGRMTAGEGDYGLWNTDDFTKELLDVDMEQYGSIALGLVVERSEEEEKKVEFIKGLASQIAQNSNVSLSMLIELSAADNMSELRSKIVKLEGLQNELSQASAENDKKAKKEADDRLAILKTLEAELQIKIDNNKAKNEKELKLLEIDGNLLSFNQDGDQNDNGIPDINEVYKRYVERENSVRKFETEALRINQAERFHQSEVALRKEELRIKEEDSKRKAATALKNKTSGEK